MYIFYCFARGWPSHGMKHEANLCGEILLKINALSWTAIICVSSSFTDCDCQRATHSKHV
jgi:hypothetical protein